MCVGWGVLETCYVTSSLGKRERQGSEEGGRREEWCRNAMSGEK